MNKQQLADIMATKKYLANGHFGGVGKASGGKMVSIKYFDHKQAVVDSLKEIDAHPELLNQYK